MKQEEVEGKERAVFIYLKMSKTMQMFAFSSM